ncbi:hypothetical protein [uncultured Flavobacterium sp.]|uniref:hypothetical protein n=1 Tax=uncultured Flavobacterium sp. TaxID=165435 RepID=UPI0025E76674|nr:hypothetical protein [uncultured Flavobacterium sp.]
MEYLNITSKISETLGINEAIFNLNFVVKDSSGLVLAERIILNKYYVSKFELWQNIEEGWKSIALYIPTKVIKEFLDIFNVILEEEGEELIDINNIPAEVNYSTDDKSFNVLLISRRDDHYRMEFAKKDE